MLFQTPQIYVKIRFVLLLHRDIISLRKVMPYDRGTTAQVHYM